MKDISWLPLRGCHGFGFGSLTYKGSGSGYILKEKFPGKIRLEEIIVVGNIKSLVLRRSSNTLVVTFSGLFLFLYLRLLSNSNLTLSCPRGSPLTSKIVWRWTE